MIWDTRCMMRDKVASDLCTYYCIRLLHQSATSRGTAYTHVRINWVGGGGKGGIINWRRVSNSVVKFLNGGRKLSLKIHKKGAFIICGRTIPFKRPFRACLSSKI